MRTPPTITFMQAPTPPLSLAQRLLLASYGALWFALLPLALVYLWRKGRREPLYRAFLAERFGRLPAWDARPVWLHAASLGELRGAAPLVRALLAEGHALQITTLTPAGRTAASTLFADALAQGRLRVAYTPVEQGWAVKAMLRRVRPVCALMAEIDTWPVLLTTVRRAGLPLGMVNAQYPRDSAVRDRQRLFGLRAALFRCYDLVLCKSEVHAERFRAAGCPRVEVSGETRFELPIPQALLDAAPPLLAQLNQHGARPVLCVASSMPGEDEVFIEAFLKLQGLMAERGAARPLLVHVPRHPQRFDLVFDMLQRAGLRTVRRSRHLDAALGWQGRDEDLKTADVLLGDSLGEMYFFIALSQTVVVGSSFVPLGAHNIIEPLALKKPVFVGPSIWGIEYPGVEALAAGVLRQVADAQELAQALAPLLADAEVAADFARAAQSFFEAHAGATARHMGVLRDWIPAAGRPRAGQDLA
jgi:3-deoxy-D-manno-octulosonic-acid transferase